MKGCIDVTVNLEEHQEHLKIIKEALESEKAYLFVGAGFSQNAEAKTVNPPFRYKNWTDFMIQLAEKLWPNDSSDKITERVAGDHLFIAQLFEEEFGKDQFYKELLEAVPYKDYVPSAIHKELIDISDTAKWKGFITTNQDCLIEQTLDEQHMYHDQVVDDLDLSTKLAQLKVLKLHGTMERPSSIIFSEEQYRTYKEEHPLLHLKVRSIFAENIVVFVGFSLTDSNFKSIFGWVRDILSTNYQKKAYAFIFDKDIDDYTRRYWEKRNIIILPISTEGFYDWGQAFTSGVREYIQYFHETGKVESNVVREIVGKIQRKAWNQEQKDHLIGRISAMDIEEHLSLHEFDTIMEEVYATLDDKEKLELLLVLFPYCQYHFRIDEKTIMDTIIMFLEKDRAQHDKGLLYEFLALKTEQLFSDGMYDETKKHIEDSMRTHPHISTPYKNELIYWKICVAKFSLEFREIKEGLQYIEVDWQSPLWLNRLASIHTFIGEYRIALNYYNRAIEIGKQKKDEWNTHLSAYSKMSLFTNIMHSQLSKLDEEQTKKVVENTRSKLEEKQNPTLKKWKELEGLKDKWWTGYKKWEFELGATKHGYHSFKSGAVHEIFQSIWFFQKYGFPHQALLGKKFDVVANILAENQYYERASSLSIILGFDKQIELIFSNKTFLEMDMTSLDRIYEDSCTFGQSLLEFMHEQQRHSDHSLVGVWVQSILSLWKKIIPFLSDDKIAEVENLTWQIRSATREWKGFDTFSNIQTRMIEVASLCLFYNRKENSVEILSKWLTGVTMDHRITRALNNIKWKEFEGAELVDDQLLASIITKGGKSASLLYHLLEANILKDEQKKYVYQQIFCDDEELESEKLLLYPYLDDDISDGMLQEIISAAIEKYQLHHSSSDLITLYRIAEVTGKMTAEQIRLVCEITEKKIIHARKNRQNSFLPVFTEEEMTGGYIVFLSNLLSKDKLLEGDLIKKMEEFHQWDASIGQIFSIINQYEGITKVVDLYLLEGIRSAAPETRKEYCYLVGRRLQNKGTQEGKKLLQNLFYSVFDTNIDVASMAIHGVALIVMENSKVISESMLEEIIRFTKDTDTLRHIGYLTNLAFLYKQLRDKGSLTSELVDEVEKVIEKLKEMPFASVRKELE